MMTLVIDDLRDIKGDVICRTFDGARIMIEHIGSFDRLYLDHDLGHPKDSCNGYKLISLIEEKCYDEPKLWPLEVIVVTANPSGRLNIEAVLKKYYDLNRNDGCWTLKEDL